MPSMRLYASGSRPSKYRTGATKLPRAEAARDFVQGLEHETVSTKRHNDIGLARIRFSVALCQGISRRFRLRAARISILASRRFPATSPSINTTGHCHGSRPLSAAHGSIRQNSYYRWCSCRFDKRTGRCRRVIRRRFAPRLSPYIADCWCRLRRCRAALVLSSSDPKWPSPMNPNTAVPAGSMTAA